MKKKLRAAIYSRISSTNQLNRTEYDSIKSHLDQCKDYILIDCPVAYTNAERIESAVVEKLKELADDKVTYVSLAKRAIKDAGSAAKSYEEERIAIKRRLSGIKKELDSLL